MRLHWIGVGLLTMGLSIMGRADTIYTYTGPTFAFVDASSGLTTSNFISLSMTFANPIAASIGVIGSAGSTASSLVAVTPTQFTITDGVHTLDNSNAQVSIFDVATDASGNIVAWGIFASQPDIRSGVSGNFDLGTDNSLRDASGTGDPLIVDHSCFEPGNTHQCGDTASTVFDGLSGTWTITTTSSSVPEPSVLILFGPGVIAASLARTRLRGWQLRARGRSSTSKFSAHHVALAMRARNDR